MTRENKVALVVGFALVLLVGVLISDHLSAARSQRSADLAGPHPEQVSDHLSRQQLVDLQGEGEPAVLPVRQTLMAALGAPVVPPEPVPAVSSLPVRRQQLEEVPSRPQPVPVAALDERQAVETRRVYEVKPGESLSEICQRFYGTAAHTDRLAACNGIDDPDAVRSGSKLLIPLIGQLLGSPDSAQVVPPPEPAAAAATYQVQPGDSLTEIASRLLGSATRWRQLYQLNRNVIKDPDHIKVGTVLNLPRSAP